MPCEHAFDDQAGELGLEGLRLRDIILDVVAPPPNRPELPKAYYTKEEIEKFKDALVHVGCFQQAPRKRLKKHSAQCKDRPVF